jgi:predicted GTPase
MVGSTVQRVGELLQDVATVLLDEGGGTASSLATQQRAAAWAKDLDALARRAEMRPVVVGVVGDTGAGKSSMLNALLGEEEVLPQNGMRACTACVVEVSGCCLNC